MNTEDFKSFSITRAAIAVRASGPTPEFTVQTAHRRTDQLLRLAPSGRLRMLEHCSAESQLHLLATVQEAAWACRREDPVRCLELAEGALEVALVLDARCGSAALLADLKAETWGLVGNARRVLEDYKSAESAFRASDGWLHHGSGNVLLSARLQSLRGSLRRDQRKLLEAVRCAERASELYLAAGQHQTAGRELLGAAYALSLLSKPAQALAMTERASHLLDLAADPRLGLSLLHNTALYFLDLGDPASASRILEQTSPLHEHLGEEVFALRARWVEGRILAKQKLPKICREAEARLEEVIAAFRERELYYDAALCGLDLAIVYAERGAPEKVASLAERLVPVFAAQGVPREADAAFQLFRQAAKQEKADVDAIRRTVIEVRLAERVPA